MFYEEDVGDFLCLHDDNDHNQLSWAAAMIVGVQGALRIQKLTNLEWKDIILENDCFEIWIRSSKTDQAKKGWCFRVCKLDAEIEDRDPFLR